MRYIDIFDLFRRNVFTISNFHDVLLSVNDFKAAFRGIQPNIPSVQPAIFINSLLRLLIELKVARDHLWTADQNLSSWLIISKLSKILFRIEGVVLHIRNIFKLVFARFHRSPNMSISWVIRIGYVAGSTYLSLSIALYHWTAHGDLEEVLDVCANRSSSGDHEPHSATQDAFDFIENHLIIEPVGVAVALLKFLSFCFDSFFDEPSSYSGLLLEFSIDHLVKSVVDPWNSHKHCWPKLFQIILH